MPSYVNKIFCLFRSYCQTLWMIPLFTGYIKIKYIIIFLPSHPIILLLSLSLLYLLPNKQKAIQYSLLFSSSSGLSDLLLHLLSNYLNILIGNFFFNMFFDFWFIRKLLVFLFDLFSEFFLSFFFIEYFLFFLSKFIVGSNLINIIIYLY